jgi:ubiquinone/menaquinone biosynthesis C-methylase UbiE
MSYLHGYAAEEQARLERQARLLQPMLFEGWEVLGRPRRVLEVGCGTGSQLRSLAQRYPEAQLVGLDPSPEQLAEARRLGGSVAIEWVESRGEDMPFPDQSFDLICLFWVLEHVFRPEAVLSSIHRVLQPGGRVALSEVHNPSLYFYPECPRAAAFWAAYNQLQKDLGGHPEIGVQLPVLAVEQGWEVLHTRRFSPRLNGLLSRREQRQEVVSFWTDLLGSARSSLLQHQRHTVDFEEVRQELQRLVCHPRGVIEYSAHQLLARKP